MRPTDEELLSGARAGRVDGAVLDELVVRHGAAALRLAAGIVGGGGGEAEDAAQEAFLKLVAALRAGAYDARRGRFAPFFFRLVRNAALDRLRARRAEERRE